MPKLSDPFPDVHDLDFVEGKKILIVDDEEDIASSLKRLLELALPGVIIETTGTGEEAVDMLEATEYDTILCDYRLPGIGGLDVLNRALDKQPMVPRVLFSAYADLDMALAAINDLRVESVLTKPLDNATLVYMVNDLLVERHMQE